MAAAGRPMSIVFITGYVDPELLAAIERARAKDAEDLSAGR